MKSITKLRRLAKPHGVEVVELTGGHFKLKGKLVVNYYPESKNRTAYVERTKKGVIHVSPEKAIEMCLTPPPVVKGKTKRVPQTKAKRRMLKKTQHCHWCGMRLTKETATVDHVVPLSRGGLNNTNNKVLACEPCNKKRANHMPELKGATQ